MLETLINKISEKHNADIYFYAGPISRLACKGLLFTEKLNENALLILYTFGGDPDAAYKIVKHFHKNYNQFKILILDSCKSAGSLISLGADEVIMGPHGELGPLDMQQSKSDEVGELTSHLNIPIALNVLSNRAVISFQHYLAEIRKNTKAQVTTKTAADIAARLSIGLHSKIFEKIDPSTLGEGERAIQIAHKYAERIQKGNLMENCINNRIYNYPSHGFVIDYEEATKLFKNVKEADENEKTLLLLMSDIFCKIKEAGGLFTQPDGSEIYFKNLTEVYNADSQNEVRGKSDQSDSTAATAQTNENCIPT